MDARTLDTASLLIFLWVDSQVLSFLGGPNSTKQHPSAMESGEFIYSKRIPDLI